MFDNHFEVFLADTEESKNIHYNIRYQVYCEEMGFENGADFPLKMEYDNDDDRSIHFIVKSKVTDQWVGAMRLIFKQDSLLPIEENCKINEKIITNDLYGAVELSRLCLVKDVRRGFVDIDPPHGILSDENKVKESNKIKLMPTNQKINRMIIWGLIYAAAKYCVNNNISNWYFMTTSALARLLCRGGLNLISIGKPCQHKGERFPFRMNVVETYQSQVWQDDFNNDYSIFSESEDILTEKLASVA